MSLYVSMFMINLYVLFGVIDDYYYYSVSRILNISFSLLRVFHFDMYISFGEISLLLIIREN